MFLILSSFIAVNVYLVFLLSRKKVLQKAQKNQLEPQFTTLAIVSVIGQFILTFGNMMEGRYVDTSVNNTILFIATGLIASWLFLYLRYKRVAMGVLLVSINALVMVVLLFNENHSPLAEAKYMQHALGWHTLSASLAYSLFLLCILFLGLMSVKQLLVHGKINFPWLQRTIPPLEMVEQSLFQYLVIGFLVLSWSLITGLIFALSYGSFADHSTKLAFGFLTWLVFGALIAGKLRQGWRGTTTMRWFFLGIGFLTIVHLISTQYL